MHHRAGMLENEGAGQSFQCASKSLDGDVGSGAFDFGARCEHLPFASTLHVAAILLVESHAVKLRLSGFIVLGGNSYVEGSCRVISHGLFLSRLCLRCRNRDEQKKREFRE